MTDSANNANIRRTAWLLAAVAIAFYVGFIAIGVMNS